LPARNPHHQNNRGNGLTTPSVVIHFFAHNARGSFGETVLGRLLGAGPCFLPPFRPFSLLAASSGVAIGCSCHIAKKETPQFPRASDQRCYRQCGMTANMNHHLDEIKLFF